MERVASVTSSYYKFAEGAILVFALDNASSFHALSQHLLDIVSYAENAKIFLCGNKLDLVGRTPQVKLELSTPEICPNSMDSDSCIFFGFCCCRSPMPMSTTLSNSVKI